MMGPVCWSLALPILLGAAQDDTWKTITPKDAGFSVSMPGVPVSKKQQVKTATGQLTVTMLIAEGRNDANFVVSYSDFPDAELKKGAREKRLDHAREGAVSSARGKLKSEKAIELDGHAGREIVIEKDGEIVAKMRIYLVKNRLYQVMALGSGQIFSPKEKDVGTFLDSFRLIK